MLFSKESGRVMFVFLSIIVLFGVFYFSPRISFSQTAVLTPEQESALRAELAGIEKESQELEKILITRQKEGTSISRDIAILDAKIKQAQLKIRAHEISINNLGKDIVVKTNTITALSEKIGAGQESLSQIIQNTRELDDLSLAESFLSNKNISEFFIDIDNFFSIKQSLSLHLDNVKGAKKSTEVVKEQLGEKRDKEVDAKFNVEQEQAKIKKMEVEKQKLLSLNKNEQQTYKTIISNKAKRANEIKNALFPLAGTSQKINFSTALIYAREAKEKTGIDPVFVMAILTQESRLGANVGKCNTLNTQKWNDIMPGPTEYQRYLSNGKSCKNVIGSCSSRDDQTPFKKIVSALGKQPEDVVLSCPIKSAGPWGGAMGPAQFIPSTWSLFSTRLKSILGYDSSPWNPRDAFIASALYLTDLGAIGESYSSQIKAACKYYGSGGSSCSYGLSVMKIKNTIQSDINELNTN